MGELWNPLVEYPMAGKVNYIRPAKLRIVFLDQAFRCLAASTYRGLTKQSCNFLSFFLSAWKGRHGSIRVGDLKAAGFAHTNIGGVYWNLRQYQKALEYHQKALDISTNIRDIKGESVSLINIGLVYDDLGHYHKALECYQKALNIDRKIGDVNGEANVLTNIGNVYADFGQYEKAIGYYAQALPIYRKIGDVRGEARGLNNMGYALLYFGKISRAAERLGSAADFFEAIRGQVHSDRERTSFQFTLPDVYSGLAAAFLELGSPQGAFEAIERGRAKSFLDLLGTRASGTKRSKNKTQQIATIENQLSRLHDMNVKPASAPVGAKTRSARKALHQVISELDKQRLELIDQLRRSDPELGYLAVVDPPNLKEIQSLLPRGTALVEYFHPGKHTVSGKEQDQLWIFVVGARGLHFKAVAVYKADLEKALEEYAKLVADGSSNPKAVASVGAKLHKWLIEPVEPISQLTNAKTLVFVPWGPMFKIPFAALGPKGSNPLGAKKNIVMAPSAGVYRYLSKKRSSGRKNILSIGNLPVVQGDRTGGHPGPQGL